jgi:hypothetical protein
MDHDGIQSGRAGSPPTPIDFVEEIVTFFSRPPTYPLAQLCADIDQLLEHQEQRLDASYERGVKHERERCAKLVESFDLPGSALLADTMRLGQVEDGSG